MRNLSVFNSISLDGYFVDQNGDMSWAYNPVNDEEWDAFVAGNASGGGELVFGRVTYQMMASYWPTEQAQQNDPVVAAGMNSLPKVVFSRTLKEAAWNNTRLVKDGLTAEIRSMKQQDGPDMVILGSGSLVAQLSQERLIDEYQLVVVPVVLSSGRTMFAGLQDRLALRLLKARSFANGNHLLVYEPVR